MTAKIKIAYVIDNFVRGGGTENQLAALIAHLDRDVFEPHVFNLRPPSPNPIEINCPVTYLNLTSLKSPRLISVVRQLAGHFKREKIDIAQVYWFDSRFVTMLATMLQRPRRVVFCRREMGYWHTPLKLKIMRLMASRSDYCLVNAESIKLMVTAAERFDPDKIEVIYNGVPYTPPDSSPADIRSMLSIPLDVPVVGIVANLRPVKCLDRFIQAAASVENTTTHFVIVGKGELKDNLLNQAKQLGIGNRIRIFHSTGNIYNLISLFDIGILTSKSEGLSNVLIEYAMAGLPTIAYNVGGNAEVVIDSQTGYILDNGDIDGLAEKISILLADNDLRGQFGKAARTRADHLFSVMAMVEKTQEFYRRLLAADHQQKGDTA